ncbi:MAG: AAC(3) family N-acetyltransferase [Theionarchaea archaeon]|nr:AAC(3) family N-acetyltransferase [Theionarchaea archaeon]
MPEASLIENTPFPQTQQSLARDLRRLGVARRMTLLVHSSLNRIGWVSGGPVAVVQALMDTLTEEGTLVMPTHSGDYSNPENWSNPPVPQEWVKTIKETMPAFNPIYTPTREMGRIVDCFRTFPGVLRSNHPTVSFAAWGRHKRMVTGTHGFSYSLGVQSPLGKLYALNGWILLMGVSYAKNTSFHLAEYRLNMRKRTMCEAPVLEEGKRVWKAYEDIDYNSDEFEAMGEDFEKACDVKKGYIGLAASRLFSQKEAVDYAMKWLGDRTG